jgi:kinesin family protein 18/19
MSNLDSISKDDSRDISKDLSNLSIHKKSRVVDP